MKSTAAALLVMAGLLAIGEIVADYARRKPALVATPVSDAPANPIIGEFDDAELQRLGCISYIGAPGTVRRHPDVAREEAEPGEPPVLGDPPFPAFRPFNFKFLGRYPRVAGPSELRRAMDEVDQGATDSESERGLLR